MKKKMLAVVLTAVMSAAALAGCGTENKAGAEKNTAEQNGADDSSEKDTGDNSSGKDEEPGTEQAEGEKTEIQVFIAASLNTVMTQIAQEYNKEHPEVQIVFNADSSGTLLTQIQEGYECDIFFSASLKQMDTLESDGLVMDNTRANVVNNQVVVVSLKDSGTAVTGLENLKDAKNIALAGGSVPAGKYTRQALVNLGILEKAEDVSAITTEQVSESLGGVEISEQDNVSKVLIAVTEGACEVGTTYYSDTYGYEDKLKILEQVSYELTGDVIYPICLVKNPEADESQSRAAEEFYEYVLSDEAKAIFVKYYFDTNVER